MRWSPDAQHDQQDDGDKLQHSTQRNASTKSEQDIGDRLNDLGTAGGPEDRSPREYIDKMTPV